MPFLFLLAQLELQTMALRNLEQTCLKLVEVSKILMQKHHAVVIFGS